MKKFGGSARSARRNTSQVVPTGIAAIVSHASAAFAQIPSRTATFTATAIAVPANASGAPASSVKAATPSR